VLVLLITMTRRGLAVTAMLGRLAVLRLSVRGRVRLGRMRLGRMCFGCAVRAGFATSLGPSLALGQVRGCGRRGLGVRVGASAMVPDWMSFELR
jgi:hypothetical protein